MTTLSPTEFLDPFVERAALLEQRVQNIKSLHSLLTVLVHGQTACISDDDRPFLLRYFGVSDVTNCDRLIETYRIRSAGIRPQLAQCLLTLDQPLKKLMLTCQQLRSLLQSGNYSAASKLLLNTEQTTVRQYEKLMDFVRTVLVERVENRSRFLLTLADLFGNSLLKAVVEKISLNQTTGQLRFVSPVFFQGEISSEVFESVSSSRAFSALTQLKLRVSDRTPSFSESSLCTLPVIRRLYTDLRLDTEIFGLLQQIAVSRRISSLATRQLLDCRTEIVSEILATLCAGPAYASASLEALSVDAGRVTGASYSAGDLPAYFRWALQWSTLEKMGFFEDAERQKNAVERFYGPVQFAATVPVAQPTLIELVRFIEVLTPTLIDSPLVVLGQMPLSQCLPVYDIAVHQRAFEIAEHMVKESGFAFSLLRTRTDSTNGKKQKKEKDQTLSAFEMQAVIGALRILFEQSSINGLPVEQFIAAVEKHLSDRLPALQEQAGKMWPEAVHSPVVEVGVN